MGTRLGSGDWQYEMVADWARLPEGWSLFETPGVTVDADDNVYVLSRGDHPVIVFDRAGKMMASWGEGQFGRPHGITYTPEGTLFCVDDVHHVVTKRTLDGRVLMTLGQAGEPAPLYSGQPFNRPTTVALAPDGQSFYVSDGYGNARVHKYTAQGQHVLSWGEYGTGPGQFNLPHAVATDRQGLVYVADRESHRVQVFDPGGRYVTQWNNMHRPCAIYITDTDPQVCFIGQLGPSLDVNNDYPNLGGRISIHDLQGHQLAWLGDLRRGEGPTQFIAPHGIAVDSHGDVYVAEVSWANYGKFLDPPRQMRSFVKLVRLG